MNLLGLAVVAALITVILTLWRNNSLKRWARPSRIEEAMEFACFSASPHPIYPNSYIVWLSATLIVLAQILFYISSSLALPVVSLVAGMAAFFAYDLIGSSVRTKLFLLPSGIYFESEKNGAPNLFIPKEDVQKMVKTANGLFIALSAIKLGNRIPLKTRKADEIIEKYNSIIETDKVGQKEVDE